MTVVNIATEDELSERVAVRLVTDVVPNGMPGLMLRKGGFGYLRSSLKKFKQMAQREYVLLLTDLDRQLCAPSLIANWTADEPLPNKLIVRVPVREIEAWLLADRQAMAGLMGINEARLPPHPDNLPDPKQSLLNVARVAKRSVRSDLILSRGAIASQGLGYNRILSDYVDHFWDINRAAERSNSLQRAISRLATLEQ